MARRQFIASVALALAVIGGCEGTPPRKYSSLTSTGVPLDSMLNLVGSIRLTDAPDHPLGRVSSIAATPWGEIVISDDAMREVKVFGGDGRFRGLLGRTGSGPGEFEVPMGVAITASGDGVVVTDFMQPRYLVYFHDSAAKAPATVQYSTPGFIVAKTTPWQGDSMILLGAMNRYSGDSVFDAAVIDGSGRLGRHDFRRPAEFDGRGLAINLGVANGARAGSTLFLGSNLWGGILRRRGALSSEDTLFLPPAAFKTIEFPDTALNGPKAMSDFIKANPQITDMVAVNDSTMFITVARWDLSAEAMRFKILAVHWGASQSVVETPFGTTRIRARLGDTLVVTRGEVGDTVWVEKFILRGSHR